MPGIDSGDEIFHQWTKRQEFARVKWERQYWRSKADSCGKKEKAYQQLPRVGGLVKQLKTNAVLLWVKTKLQHSKNLFNSFLTRQPNAVIHKHPFFPLPKVSFVSATQVVLAMVLSRYDCYSRGTAGQSVLRVQSRGELLTLNMSSTHWASFVLVCREVRNNYECQKERQTFENHNLRNKWEVLSSRLLWILATV